VTDTGAAGVSGCSLTCPTLVPQYVRRSAAHVASACATVESGPAVSAVAERPSSGRTTGESCGRRCSPEGFESRKASSWPRRREPGRSRPGWHSVGVAESHPRPDPRASRVTEAGMPPTTAVMATRRRRGRALAAQSRRVCDRRMRRRRLEFPGADDTSSAWAVRLLAHRVGDRLRVLGGGERASWGAAAFGEAAAVTSWRARSTGFVRMRGR
jgi:hypothetical protein